jgi:hypothetical protein
MKLIFTLSQFLFASMVKKYLRKANKRYLSNWNLFHYVFNFKSFIDNKMICCDTLCKINGMNN